MEVTPVRYKMDPSDLIEERLAADAALVIDSMVMTFGEGHPEVREFIDDYIDRKINRMSVIDRLDMDASAEMDSLPVSLFCTVKLGLSWNAARRNAARLWDIADRNSQAGF